MHTLSLWPEQEHRYNRALGRETRRLDSICSKTTQRTDITNRKLSRTQMNWLLFRTITYLYGPIIDPSFHRSKPQHHSPPHAKTVERIYHFNNPTLVTYISGFTLRLQNSQPRVTIITHHTSMPPYAATEQEGNGVRSAESPWRQQRLGKQAGGVSSKVRVHGMMELAWKEMLVGTRGAFMRTVITVNTQCSW